MSAFIRPAVRKIWQIFLQTGSLRTTFTSRDLLEFTKYLRKFCYFHWAADTHWHCSNFIIDDGIWGFCLVFRTTQPARNVGPTSGRQRYDVETSYRCRPDVGPLFPASWVDHLKRNKKGIGKKFLCRSDTSLGRPFLVLFLSEFMSGEKQCCLNHFFFQAIAYEGQDKNPEMCRVLLTHEVMCR